MRPLLLLAIALPSTALAGQAVSPTVFEGPYDLSCASAALQLHLSVGAATAAGSGSWSDVVTFPLACSISPTDLADEVASIEAGCVGAGLPASACMQAADDLYVSLLPFTTLGASIMPTSMVVDVDASNWWGRLFGVYPAWIRYGFADGSVAPTYHWFDNTAGAPEGHFVSVGAGLQGVGAQSNGGCVASALAAIDGRVHRAAGFTASGTFGVDQSLTCLASDGTVLVGLNVGLSFSGTMSGSKVP